MEDKFVKGLMNLYFIIKISLLIYVMLIFGTYGLGLFATGHYLYSSIAFLFSLGVLLGIIHIIWVSRK